MLTGANTATALAALVALHCVLSILLKVGVIALMWRFPLTAASQAEIRAGIAASERPPP
ncbi:MAG: hypothetical protein WCI59_20910 [Betaproteobacteria bacterium]|jgi:Na+/melibiose symporter-like transporter